MPRLLAVAVLVLSLVRVGAQQTDQALPRDPGPFLPGNTQGTGARARGPQPVAGPAPHLANGLPDFGGDGAWYPGFAGNLAETQWKGVKSADTHVDVPFLPSALQLFKERADSMSKDDPEAQCLPVGVPRFMFDPYAFQMIQLPGSVLFLFEGDNYPWRTVRIDRRAAHPAGLKPTWMGDATGWYEGETLVVDVVGFNDKSWLDQAGHPHTGQMHLTERYTRTDSLTLKYQVTIDDPAAYSQPWTASNTVRFRPGFQLMEYVCDENEKDSAHMRR